MTSTLELVLILLAAAVMVVVFFRLINLPPVLGYLLVGAAIGPHAFAIAPDTPETRHLAEFGVVFLMFSIGLEFSLPRIYSMKRIVFGLGCAQVGVTLAVVLATSVLAGISWRGGVALGGILAMSSTALLSKLLTDRLELDSRHGREVMGVLLFQDLAVVPLLILIPALGQSAQELPAQLAIAAAKAAGALVLILFFGQGLMRWWFHIVAERRSAELFMLNVLLITLGLAYLTELAGLSLALGAFLAGMLISETEYRYQVEDDIKPFRDVLLGLFFITVGMLLDLNLIASNLWYVVGLLLLLLLGKFSIVALLSRAFGTTPGTAMRSGLWLCAGGEFGFVLLAQTQGLDLLPAVVSQVAAASLVLSMLAAPLIIHYSDRIVMRFAASEWLLRSMELTRVAAQSMTTERHAIICGYGRSGQHLARMLEQEDVRYVALDLDPERVREAAVAGEAVVYGDAARRETLTAAGIMRASVLVVSFADSNTALRVIHHAHALRQDLAIVVRAADEGDLERLLAAGATEVVPDTLESSMTLASHALVLLGTPIHRVIKRIRTLREGRYGLLRGFFHGASDVEGLVESQQARLHSVSLSADAYAVGRCLGDLELQRFGVSVSAVRRRNIRGLAPVAETYLETGDVLVLLGNAEGVMAAELRLLKG